MVRRLLLLLPLLLSRATPPATAQDLAGHGGPVRALAALPDGLASAGFDGAIIWWDPETGRARQVSRWHATPIGALAAAPDGTLASGGDDGRIAIWPPGGGTTPRTVLEGHAAPITSLTFVPWGAIWSASLDGTIRIWRPDGMVDVVRNHDSPVAAVAWRPDGQTVSAGHDGTLRFWSAVDEHRVLQRLSHPILSLTTFAGWSLALGSADGSVHIVGGGGVARAAISIGDRPVVALAASLDGRRLAAAGVGGGVTLLALPDGRIERTLDGPGLPVWSLAFSADGKTLWTGGQDRLVRRWDAATGAALGPLAKTVISENAGDTAGARVFRACSACHALRPTETPMAGPHLEKLFGRRMGSVAGYTYSARLAAGDVVWTPATVAQLFTEGPDVMLPGTRMPVQTVGDADDLAALLRFLEAATR